LGRVAASRKVPQRGQALAISAINYALPLLVVRLPKAVYSDRAAQQATEGRNQARQRDKIFEWREDGHEWDHAPALRGSITLSPVSLQTNDAIGSSEFQHRGPQIGAGGVRQTLFSDRKFHPSLGRSVAIELRNP
jgi:hypothetical protein